MIRHVALFRWKPDVTRAQVDEVMRHLGRLTEDISEIRHYQYGPNAGLTPDTADFVIVADFDTAEDFHTYNHHPAQREMVANVIRPLVADAHRIQLATPD